MQILSDSVEHILMDEERVPGTVLLGARETAPSHDSIERVAE